MKKQSFTSVILALLLSAQLNFCSAEKNYDEEITLPIGTNFDLEMEEVTRYEYDGAFVKAQTVNGKEQFILQKEGDTIINVVMDDKGQKTELRVLVHIVSEQKFNGGTATTKPTTTPTTAAPATTTPVKSNTTAVPATTTSASQNTPSQTVATQSPSIQKPATTTYKPATPATTQSTVNTQTVATAPAPEKPKTEGTTTKTEVAANQTKPEEPKPLTAIKTSQTYYRPTSQPANSLEAVKYKADQYAFDVLDLVNAERGKYNLRPLSMARDLQGEATLRARELPVRFSHTRPDGTKFTTIMSSTGKIQGENFAAGQISPAAVVKAWMNSTVHRENILNPNYTELGVGYYETKSATYPYYWVQLFRG